MRRLILLALLFPIGLMAQGYSLENFSQFTSGHTLSSCSGGSGDCATLFNSWYGTGTNNASGNQMISNSTGALTIQSTAACPDGDPPGHSGKYLDYSTTLGTGVASQIIYLYMPTSGLSTNIGGSFWFCSTIPVTDNWGTSFDGFQLIDGVSSRLSNYVSTGTQQYWTLECSGCAANVPYIPNNFVKVVWQYVKGAACTDTTNFTDCIVIQLYNRSGTLLGTGHSTLASATPLYMNLGNGNNAPLSTGHHVQYSDIEIYDVGYSTTQLASIGAVARPAADGLITPGRYIDWTKSGIPSANSGPLPDASWTQCGSTVAAYSGTAATINTALSGCSANQYVLLGTGTFTLTTAINAPTGGNVVLRGSGSNSTFLVFTASSGCAGQISAAFCMDAADHNYTTLPPATIYNVTAGLAQGSTQLTLSSVTGIVNGSLLFMDQCDTGMTGTPCSGTVTDNGNYFVCGAQWSSPNGCSFDGPDAGGSRTNRNQLEAHTVTNVAGSVVTITPPVSNPNFASGQSPQVYVVQPLTNVGIENLSIDLTSASAPTGCVDVFNATLSWISGVKCVNNKRAAFNLFQAVNFIVQNSYWFNSTGSLPSNYGLRASASSYLVLQNNIGSHIQGGQIFYDGACVGCVEAYNYFPDSNTNGGSLTPITEHSGDQLNHHEGTIGPGVSCDNIHGSCDLSTRFRNFWPGWESVPSTPVTTFTNGTADFAFARYIADIANVQGTPGYHTSYTSVSTATSVYNEGTGGGATSVPTDTLTKSTTLKWASYDNVTGTVRYCGNSLDTGWSATCGSTSESPTVASIYPNFVPVVGDTAIGEPALPASFYLTSKPSWLGSLPWPGIGPDISGGNVIQCGGTINTVGKVTGVPALATNGTTCTSGGTGWAGHVNANAAMTCYLNTMGGAPDGSSGVLAFDAGICYSGSAGSPIATFTPASPINVGQAPVGLSSNPIAVTLQNTGTANLVVTAVSLGSAQFSLTSNTCGSPATITNGIPGTGFTLTPGQSCGFNVVYTPATPNFTNTTSVFFSPGASNPDVLNLSGVSTGPPAPATVMFAGRVNTGSLCKAVPATTQLCYAMDCGCMWLSMSGGAFLQMGVASVNGKKGNVVLGIQ